MKQNSCQNLLTDKIHELTDSFLVIQTLSSKYYFCCPYYRLGASRKKKIVLRFLLMKFISAANQTVQNKQHDQKLELYHSASFYNTVCVWLMQFPVNPLIY